MQSPSNKLPYIDDSWNYIQNSGKFDAFAKMLIFKPEIQQMNFNWN